MDVKTFYKTQSEVAEAINKLIDSYWDDDIKEEILIDSIKRISQNNEHLIYKESDFTSVVKLKCGKRRLELVSKVLSASK
jgi:uncharacterized protein (TIGR04540 family)